MIGALGLDIGGTKVAAGVVDERGRVHARREASTAALRAAGDPWLGLAAMGRESLAAARVARPEAVGICLPGPTDPGPIRMLAAPTIPEFHRRDLRPLLEGEFGCPAAGENDARACALAECRFGAGRGCRWMVYMTVSTGNGGGVILDGRLLRGATGTAGEVGHQAILPEGGGPCDCGGRGCLETLASGRAIAARGRAALQAVRPDRDHSDLTARDVHAAFLAGEEWAKRVWADTALYLGLGIANLINAYDPEAVVLGGGVIDGAGEDLLAPVRAVVWERCMPSLSRPVAICAAALGPDTGILAAATLAWNPLHIPEH